MQLKPRLRSMNRIRRATEQLFDVQGRPQRISQCKAQGLTRSKDSTPTVEANKEFVQRL